MIRRACALLALLWALLAVPALAAQASEGFAQRAEDLVRLFRGEAQPEELFTPEFLAQVPPAQITAISGQLVAQHGAPQSVARIEAQSPVRGTVFIDFERAVLRLTLVLDPAPPHRISGLLVAGAEVRGDSLEALTGEIAALPGQASFAVARLGEGAPQILAGHRPDRALAIGSTFKLFILAELARQVEAGERRWEDVVALDRRSLPSGLMQTWPRGSPVTLHTLAVLMISRSDNTATDMLLHLVGRENVERMVATMGVADPARNRPFLSTLEAFALKSAPDPIIQAWIGGDEAARRRLLAGPVAAVTAESVDPTLFGGGPLHIDTVEWFASAADLARALDWLRRNGGERTLGVLAVNPGMAAEAAGDLDYVGFKGGSESGVINLTYLIRNRAGTWHAVTGSWNNPEARVDDARFLALIGRAVALVR